MKNMKSPITGKEMALKREKNSLRFRKEEFTFFSHFYVCEDSKEQFTTTQLDELNLHQIHNQYRDKYNLPFPEEIENVRKKYGLSASKMAEILGFGTNSYRNYENGEVPSNSNGKLIQLVNDPQKFRDMVELCDTLNQEEKTIVLQKVNQLIQESKENYFSNSMEDYLFGSKLPDSKSGYVKPNFIKLTEMVKFFSQRLEPWKTVLNKLLFYSDFLNYRSTCYSMSGLRYRAIKMGPVPNNYNSIYEFMHNRKSIDILNVPFSETIFGYQFYKAENQEFNDKIFKKQEVEILELVGSKFSKMKTNEVIEFSHNERAWIENQSDRKLIDYNYAFDIVQI